MIEPLESRIAPASIAVTYTDIDGDLVRITASKAGLVAPPLDPSDRTLSGGATGSLHALNLTEAGFQGATITFTVTKSARGDGLAHVGRINAAGVDLGHVTVKGDLGAIDAGDSTTTTPALRTLSVRSMGAFGLTTQGGVGDLQSDLRGSLGALRVTGDIVGAYLNIFASGGIGTISIGGSLVGDATPRSGSIVASGDIGPVKVAGDVAGGDGSFSGGIQSQAGKMGSVTIGGSLRGGAETASGLLYSFREMGAVKIGGDVLGGAGAQSGAVVANGRLTSVTIGGGLLALAGSGAGPNSASIFSGDHLGPVKIGHDMRGGAGSNSGQVTANGNIASVEIGGSLTGGSGIQSGAVFSAQNLGPVRVGYDLRGGSGATSGSIFSQFGKVASVSIGGSMMRGLGLIGAVDSSPSITGAMGVGPVRIGGDLTVGEISSGGVSSIASVTIGGSAFYGLIESGRDIGPVKIGHDFRGGGITADRNVASLSIGGSFVGEALTISRTAALPLPRGVVLAGGTLGPVKIGGDIRGGDGSDSAYIEAGRIPSVLVGGSIVTGFDDTIGTDLTHNASIRARQDIGAITVRGSLVGKVGVDSVTPVVISALGQGAALARDATTDLAIRSLTVGGRVERATVLAGFTPNERGSAGTNANASIGAVNIGGDWIASSISAGITDPAGDGFGNGDDYAIPGGVVDALFARIASITIRGAVIGTAGGGDQFGFTAQQIGSFKAGLFTAPLSAATNPVIPLTPLTGDVSIREV